MKNIVLHHLERSRSHRILWLFEELGLEYTLKTYDRHPETVRAPKTLRAIHPLGKAPIVTVGDDVLAESGAIIEYIVEKIGKLGPAAGAEQQFRYWMHYAEGSMMQPLIVRLIFEKMKQAPLPFFIKPVVKAIAKKVDAAFTQGEIDLAVGFVDGHLGKNAYFCGDAFTAADIQMSYPVEAAFARGGATVPMSNIAAWGSRIREREAYKRALDKGGPVFLDD